MNSSLITPNFRWPKPPAKSSWIGREDRWPWSERVFIDHPDIKVIVEDAWEALAHTQRKRKSRAMLILGESGAGKTRLADMFLEYTHAVHWRNDPERTIVPALKVEIPEKCSPRGFCVAILQALGDPIADKRKGNVTKACATMLRECEVRVVIIDNVQDIPTHRRARGIEQVGIRLRELIDQTTCLWLLLGTSTATEVVDSETQLVKRTPYRKTLNYFGIQDSQAAKRFVQLLHRLDEWLPLAERNTELLQKLSGQIFVATEGVLERIEDLLDQACLQAVREGKEVLSQAHFFSSFGEVYGPDVPNPFGPDFVMRRLDGVNEPFETLAKPRGKKEPDKSHHRARRHRAAH